jgi:hypothetical protein
VVAVVTQHGVVRDPDAAAAAAIHRQISAIYEALGRHDFLRVMCILSPIVNFGAALEINVQRGDGPPLSMQDFIALMWQVSQEGLRDTDHPSSRAVLLAGQLLLNDSRDGVSLFVRENLGALADLLSVLAHPDPALQPSGIAVLRKVKEVQVDGIPVVVVSGEHTFGGDAGPLIARKLFDAGIITSPEVCRVYPLAVFNPGESPADYFQLYDKGQVVQWAGALERLREKLLSRGKTPNMILLVEDDQAALKTSQIEEQITGSFPGVKLNVARTAETALNFIEGNQYDAVVSDIHFSASARGASCREQDPKKLGIEQFCWLVKDWIPEQLARSSITQARAIQDWQYSAMDKLISKLIEAAHVVSFRAIMAASKRGSHQLSAQPQDNVAALFEPPACRLNRNVDE